MNFCRYPRFNLKTFWVVEKNSSLPASGIFWRGSGQELARLWWPPRWVPCSVCLSWFWKRYIDDLILFWGSSKDNLDDFVHYLNNKTTFLQFSVESDPNSINFLDLKIFNDDANKIQTTSYRKPTERNTVLHFNSNHPRHLKSNIPTGQFLRLRRNCSTLKEIDAQTKDMSNCPACSPLGSGHAQSVTSSSEAPKEQHDLNHCSNKIKTAILKH